LRPHPLFHSLRIVTVAKKMACVSRVESAPSLTDYDLGPITYHLLLITPLQLRHGLVRRNVPAGLRMTTDSCERKTTCIVL